MGMVISSTSGYPVEANWLYFGPGFRIINHDYPISAGTLNQPPDAGVTLNLDTQCLRNELKLDDRRYYLSEYEVSEVRRILSEQSSLNDQSGYQLLQDLSQNAAQVRALYGQIENNESVRRAFINFMLVARLAIDESLKEKI